MSNRANVRQVYDAINDIALPGDIVFHIKEYPAPGPVWLRRKKVYRRYMGYHGLDNSIWHSGLYSGAGKENSGATVHPRIIHTGKSCVREDFIPPAFFKDLVCDGGSTECIARTEIGRVRGITDEQRSIIMRYARSMAGTLFGEDGISFTFWTYLFGLPALFCSNKKISCQALVYLAYAQAGITFPHHLETAPFFNLAKKRGYPIGHRPDAVNLRFPYLEDHHCYRDANLQILLAAYEDRECRAFVTEEFPQKYSWNPILQHFAGDSTDNWPSLAQS